MKGLLAVAALVVSALLWYAFWPLGPVSSLVAMFFVYQWFMFRAKWGMKF